MPKRLHNQSLWPLALLSGLAIALPTLASPIVQPELVIVDENGNNGRFGTALAATDGVLAIGSPFDSTDFISSGKVTIRRTIWTGTPSDPMQSEGALLETLTPGSGANNTTKFGSSLAFSGDCLAVGSPGWRGTSGYVGAGGVFVYDTPSSAIASTFVQVLQHADAYIGDDFGWSVDGHLSTQSNGHSERFIVGAPGRRVGGTTSGDANAGAVYVYQRGIGLSTFSLLRTLQPAWVQADDRFGEAVEHYGWFYFVGSPGWNNGEGAVYVFVADPNTDELTLLKTIAGSDTSCSSGFGTSIDFWGGYYGGSLVIGGSGGSGHASVYQVQADAQNWQTSPAVDVTHNMDLEPNDWTGVSNWGSSVSIDLLRIAVGGEGIAASYRYDLNATTLWSRLAMLDNDVWNGDIDDDLGMAVCVHGTQAWAGSPRSNEFNANDGAVARWNVDGMPNCPADLDLDYDVDADDMLILLANLGSTQTGFGSGELHSDGVINILDLLELVAAWGDCGA